MINGVNVWHVIMLACGVEHREKLYSLIQEFNVMTRKDKYEK